MPIYEYEAVDTTGQKFHGNHNAKDRSEVLQMLKGKDYYPISIVETKEIKDIREYNLTKRANIKDLSIFCRQFYIMLNAGVTIIECLEILSKQTESKKNKRAINEVYESVQKGKTLSESLSEHPNIFPSLFVYMVEAGESSGTLNTIMNRMAIYYEKEGKLKNKIAVALVYPTLLTIVTIAVVIFLIVGVIPSFINMFEANNIQLPILTSIMIGISSSLIKYWPIIFIVLIFIILFIRYSFKKENRRLFIDGLLLKLPGIKNMIIKITVARFTRTLSILLASGIPLLSAIEIVAKTIGNTVIKNSITKVSEDLRKGFNLATPIKKWTVFPPMVSAMIKIGEESGTLDEVLNKTADFYDEEVEVSSQKFITRLEPIMIIVMAIIIGFIVISMVLPMLDIINAVQ